MYQKRRKYIVVKFPLGTLKAVERNESNEAVYRGLKDSGIPAVLGMDYTIGVTSGTLSTDLAGNQYIVTWKP